MFVKEITKRYDGKAVVDGVSFEIPKGKVLSLIGPNGAGKSTVMGMLSRLIARDSGLVDFAGRDIAQWKSKELAKRLAILTQSNHIEMKLTVRELVAFGSSLSGMVMSVDNLCSEHSLEHPLSAYHPAIAHGEGLIMVSKAYYTHFVENCPELHDRFIDMAKAIGKEDAKDPMDFVTALVDLQKACGVDELKMSDYGITPDEFETLMRNTREEDLVKIYTESYR